MSFKDIDLSCIWSSRNGCGENVEEVIIADLIVLVCRRPTADDDAGSARRFGVVIISSTNLSVYTMTSSTSTENPSLSSGTPLVFWRQGTKVFLTEAQLKS